MEGRANLARLADLEHRKTGVQVATFRESREVPHLVAICLSFGADLTNSRSAFRAREGRDRASGAANPASRLFRRADARHTESSS